MEVFVSPNFWIPVKTCISFQVEDLQIQDKKTKNSHSSAASMKLCSESEMSRALEPRFNSPGFLASKPTKVGSLQPLQILSEIYIRMYIYIITLHNHIPIISIT